MLSATPVNNRFIDLRNQLALAYEGVSKNIDEQLKTKNSIDDIFRQAQTAFNKWSQLPTEERTTETLLGMLSFDFFEVLDSVTIARSRKHIQKYYESFAGKMVTFCGIGVSHQPLIEKFASFGAKVTACDKRTKEQLGDLFEKRDNFSYCPCFVG